MLKLDLSRWHHTVENLRELALTSDHPRTRERWMALYEIATGKMPPSSVKDRTQTHRPLWNGFIAITNKVH
jgi:hypothetical protein